MSVDNIDGACGECHKEDVRGEVHLLSVVGQHEPAELGVGFRLSGTRILL